MGRERTSFLGRAAELDALGVQFDLEARVVTLTGPGGAGKTRLARRFVELRGDRWPGGAVFCELADVRASEGVEAICAVVAGALGLPLSGRHALETIGEALAARGPLLVVLDNCEQVIDEVARAVDRWTEVAKEACFLLTSREVLSIAGEQAQEVPPLPLLDSVQLFMARARLDLSSEQSVIEEIVRKLDGLPLAIELAAARTAILSPHAILARLSSQLDLLSTGARDAVERQRTMRAAIAWSWDLLKPYEQAALRQCAVFRGSFSPDAAEAVIDLAAHDDAPNVLDVLQTLREKSLIRALESDALPELRCALYDTIRMFAEDRLEAAGEAKSTRDRHAVHFAKVASEWADAVPKHGGVAVLRRIGVELDNLAAAHEHSLDPRPILAMDRFVALRGPLEPHLRRIERTLASLENERQSAMRARILLVRASTRSAMGRREDARPDLEAALAIATSTGDRFIEGRALGSLGAIEWMAGRLEEADALLRASFAASEEARDDEMVGITLGRIANVLCDRGRFEESASWMERGLSAVRASGDRREEGNRLSHFGVLLDRRGRFEEALARQKEASVVFEEIGDAQRVAISYGNMGILQQTLGRREQARASYERAISWYKRAAERRFLGIVIACLGSLLHEEGRLDEARARYVEAIDLLAPFGERRFSALFRAVLGSIEAARGEVDEGLRLLDESSKAIDASDTEFTTAIALYRSLAELARSKDSKTLARTRALVESNRKAAERSDAIRAALRVVDVALKVETTAEETIALTIADDGSWFEPPKGKRVDLSGSPTLARILLALAIRHRDAHGKTIDAESLIAAGWPGERILPKAASTRLYAMLAKLRKLGLRDAVVGRPNGWLLDPSLKVVLAPP